MNNEASSDPLEGMKVISLVLDLLSEATERLEAAFEEADHMFRPNSDLIQNEERMYKAEERNLRVKPNN